MSKMILSNAGQPKILLEKCVSAHRINKESSMGWFTQDDNADAAVQVKEGEHKDTGERVTEFIVADKAGHEVQHIGINESGEEVFHTHRPN